VLGDEIDLDGRVDYRGIVRDARDQQRLYNFHVSSLVEAVGMAPRAPWVIAAGQFDGFEKIWKTANTEPHAYLPYKPLGSQRPVRPRAAAPELRTRHSGDRRRHSAGRQRLQGHDRVLRRLPRRTRTRTERQGHPRPPEAGRNRLRPLQPRT
jgi:hypothetical protein